MACLTPQLHAPATTTEALDPCPALSLRRRLAVGHPPVLPRRCEAPRQRRIPACLRLFLFSCLVTRGLRRIGRPPPRSVSSGSNPPTTLPPTPQASTTTRSACWTTMGAARRGPSRWGRAARRPRSSRRCGRRCLLQTGVREGQQRGQGNAATRDLCLNRPRFTRGCGDTLALQPPTPPACQERATWSPADEARVAANTGCDSPALVQRALREAGGDVDAAIERVVAVMAGGASSGGGGNGDDCGPECCVGSSERQAPALLQPLAIVGGGGRGGSVQRRAPGVGVVGGAAAAARALLAAT
jgi:hypothetical protein